jgi:hypothetical protein
VYDTGGNDEAFASRDLDACNHSVARHPLQPAADTSFCEWKGPAQYWTLVCGDRRLPGVAWSYPARSRASPAARTGSGRLEASRLRERQG